MYRENSYMESFRKKKKTGKFIGEDKLSYEKARKLSVSIDLSPPYWGLLKWH